MTLVSPSRFVVEERKKNEIMAISKLFALHANAVKKFNTKCVSYQTLVSHSVYLKLTFGFVKNGS